jgi:hypothetical protein
MLLKEIKLQTNQLSALFNFYKEVLELPVIQSGNNSISVTAGKSQIIFDKTNTIESPFYHFAFNIPSNKFEEAFQWMQNKVELLWLDDYNSYIADFTNWHAKSFYFIDPAGNIPEFIARFDLHDVADEPFSAAHIRNVSEIGLVFRVKDFDAGINNLLKQYPLSYFDKQPPMPHFRAVGNDEGLFVIVPENRIWFSTKNTTSRIFPIRVLFMENNKLFELKM